LEIARQPVSDRELRILEGDIVKHLLLLAALLLAPLPAMRADDGRKPFEVYVLAGQSNMEGKAPNARLDHQAAEAAEKLYPTWRQNLDQWKLTGGDHPYHYLGSAIWFNRIGKAMGETMLKLHDRAK
jgi:hypothetical protein